MKVANLFATQGIVGPNKIQGAAAYVMLTLIVIYPIAAVSIPALGDYLNHLARMHILSTHENSPDLQLFYSVQWLPIPYLAMDAVVSAMTPWIPIYDAGRIFIGICLLLPVLGVATLHYATHRHWSLFPLVAFLFSYNYVLSWGFLNYLFSIGICLLLFAGWVASENTPRWQRALLFSAGALVLYFSHIFGFIAYCIAVAGFEFGRAWRFRPISIRTIIGDWAFAAVQAVPAAFFWLMTDVETVAIGASATSFGGIGSRIAAVQSPFILFGGTAELAIGGLICALCIAGMWSGHLKLSPRIWPAAAAVAIVSLLVPEAFLGVWGMSFRLPLVAVLIFVSGISLDFQRLHWLAFVLGLAVLVGAKSILASSVLFKLDDQIAGVRQIVSHLPRGVRVLVAQAEPTKLSPRFGPTRLTMHMAMVAVIDRDAFLPFLFTGLSTVRPLPHLEPSSTPNGHPISEGDLKSGYGKTDNGVVRGDGYGRRIYWRGWEKKFDYVLVQHFGEVTVGVADGLDLIEKSDTVNLYRVRK